MRTWAFLLGGLLIWAADFFLLYAIASIFLTSPTARILSLAVTVAAVAADIWLMWRAWRKLRGDGDSYEQWIARLAFVTAALSAVAILWQGLPAIYVGSPPQQLGLLAAPVSR